MINVGRNSLAEKQLKTADARKTPVPHHNSLFKEEKSKFSLTNRSGNRNLSGGTSVKLGKFRVNELLGKRRHLLRPPYKQVIYFRKFNH
jgi:hypothetical protein